jgi:hypothetical protein
MKKIITFKITAILLLALAAAGCNSFLDEVTPQGKEPSSAYLNIEENAEKAVTALYELLSRTSGTGPDGVWIDNHYEFYLGNVASDDAEKGSEPIDYPDLQMVCQYQVNTNNTFVRNFYMNGFWGVSRANYVLFNLEDSPIDATVKQRMQGEAHFFRAYWYFYLLRHYGGMPILREPVKAEDFGNVPRASFSETLQFIVEEMKEAARLLPPKEEYLSKDLGRASRGSAQGMLARILLYSIGTDPEAASYGATWQALYDLTGEIIQSGSYQLAPNFATLFEEESDGGYRLESLFEYTGKGNWMDSFTGSAIFFMDWIVQGIRGGSGFGWGFNQPNQDLVNAFDDSDPRLSCTVYGPKFNDGIIYGRNNEPYDRAGSMMTDYYNRKVAVDGQNVLMVTGTSKAYIVIRYADILLMRAEAAYYLSTEGEARTRVNEIRQRARQSSYCKGYALNSKGFETTPSTTPNVPDLDATVTGTALLEAIWHERRLELAGENQRTYDLIRTGRLVERVGKVKDNDRENNKPGEESRIAGIRDNIIKSSLKHTVDVPGTSTDRYIPVFPIPETEVTYWNINPTPTN